MGNCLTRCFGRFDRRGKYLKTRYSTEREQSIEFETLMDDDETQEEMSRLLTDRECQLLKARQFNTIVQEQMKIDKYLNQQLAEQEDLRREEETSQEAKHDLTHITAHQKARDKAATKNAAINGSRSWVVDDEDWEVPGGEDDFEVFLANVKARSLAARAQLQAGQCDGQSSSSSNAHTKDRSLTEGSSLDLEWDHEAGVEPVLQPRSNTEENLAELTSLHNVTAASSLHSSDLEWDDSFVSADDIERRQLLGMSARNNSVR